jgi:hypothetical protein
MLELNVGIFTSTDLGRSTMALARKLCDLGRCSPILALAPFVTTADSTRECRSRTVASNLTTEVRSGNRDPSKLNF